MKKLIFLNSILALTIIFQFCTKEENSPASSLPYQLNTPESTDRSNCGCNLQVIANMAGSISTSPWSFQLSYYDASNTLQTEEVIANGTTNHSLTIKEGTTQAWQFIGGSNGQNVVNVSARLSCGGDGCKICGPIRYYVVPANTAFAGVSYLDFSTNSSCDVE